MLFIWKSEMERYYLLFWEINKDHVLSREANIFMLYKTAWKKKMHFLIFYICCYILWNHFQFNLCTFYLFSCSAFSREVLIPRYQSLILTWSVCISLHIATLSCNALFKHFLSTDISCSRSVTKWKSKSSTK